MLQYLSILDLVLVLGLAGFVLYRNIKPKLAKPIKDVEGLKRKFIDEGIALAEQMQNSTQKMGGILLTGHDKLSVAMDWAKECFRANDIAPMDAEIRKLVEISLGLKK